MQFDYNTLFKQAVPLPKTNSRHEWLLQRREGVGSSDASAIAGLSSFESPYSLWEQKTGRAPLDVPVSPRTEELREWGNRLEPVVLEAVADKLNIHIHKPEVGYANIERDWQRANLDGITGDLRICEWKTADPSQRWDWIGQIPDHAEIQVHHSAAVTGATSAIVAGLVGGNDLRVHQIEINPNIVNIITEMEAEFWGYVQRDVPPPVDGHKRTIEAITREWPHKQGDREVSVVDVEEIWERAIATIEARKQAEEAERQAKAELALLLDGHNKLTTGKRVWARAQRGQMNLTELAAAHPDLVAEFTTKPTFDLDAFKAKHPDIYTKFQSVSVRPVPHKEKI